MAGECALCAFLLCKSCFIRDIDLCARAVSCRATGTHAGLPVPCVRRQVPAAAGQRADRRLAVDDGVARRRCSAWPRARRHAGLGHQATLAARCTRRYGCHEEWGRGRLPKEGALASVRASPLLAVHLSAWEFAALRNGLVVARSQAAVERLGCVQRRGGGAAGQRVRGGHDSRAAGRCVASATGCAPGYRRDALDG